ncbi:MAG: adenylosuccinate lyase [Planctomycetota bacterium]
MISRYSRPAMAAVWSEENRFRIMLEVELLAAEAMAGRGLVPKRDIAIVRERARIDLRRIREIEDIVKHDVIAFLTQVGETVGPAARHLHLGMTSSDILDTALAVQCRDAADILLKDLAELKAILRDQMNKHRRTPMMGRTHGVHAEPTTFGLKMALFTAETARAIQRLRNARKAIAVGKISGAVGTFANVGPWVEEQVCRNLGIAPAPVSTQIVQRDRHAEFVTAMAIAGGSLEKFATEVRSLQRTEIQECEEPFTKGQKGSSAMPHKRNPILCERISGLARVLRGNAVVAMENIALWHERDISHSSAERIILPDTCLALDYMLAKAIEVFRNLTVHPGNMKANLEKSRGRIFSERVLLALVGKGLSREEAYRVVQGHAMKSFERDVSFADLVAKDPTVRKHLTKTEIRACFDLDHHFRNVAQIYRRVEML